VNVVYSSLTFIRQRTGGDLANLLPTVFCRGRIGKYFSILSFPVNQMFEVISEHSAEASRYSGNIFEISADVSKHSETIP
jgi:hypothetical protein